MKFEFITFAVLSIVFSGCNSSIRDNRLIRLDALEQQLREAESEINQMDSAAIEARRIELMDIANWMFHHNRDTLDKEIGIPLGDLLRSERNYRRALSRMTIVQKEYALANEQISALRKDVQNGLYSDDEFDRFYATEFEAITLLKSNTEAALARFKAAEKSYEKNFPIISTWIDSIKRVMYAPEPVAKP